MATKQSNQFEFVNTKGDMGTKVLNATMFDFSYAKHAHEELALGVTTGGVQEFECEGRQFRSLPGDIIAFNPGDVHNGNPGNGEALKYTMLYLDTEDFYPLIRCSAETRHTRFRIAGTHFRDSVLRSLILKMSRLVAGGKYLSVEYDQYRYEIAKCLARRMSIFSEEDWTRDKDTLLMRAREYIHDNVAGDISIDELGQVASMSKYHFIRLFRSQFGLTPHQYILNLKVNKARFFLEAGLPPSDVAQQFGFFDVSHLNRHFKRAFGLTPKQYQLQLKR
ncbi:AraC family transcriptional regulator [Pseudodesulfovibrio indicus]|uniref:AraC family transcriptional regulator n=1 Tax=Pseudodesulfovibrio indicus TaxID=1716143 RepID=UPI00293144EA|nr:AraC family transcriptional regulator [Pseudodesulfovibrio indicus]